MKIFDIGVRAVNIIHMKTFVSVAEAGSFNKAAAELFITSTAVIKQINLLEKEIGVRLFNRNNRRVELTPAGKTFLEDAKAILRRTRDAFERAKRTDTVFTGNLNIGFVKGYEKTNLSDLLADFHSQYPNISFTLTRENVAELYDGILDKSLDIIINTFSAFFLISSSIRKLICVVCAIIPSPFCCFL